MVHVTKARRDLAKMKAPKQVMTGQVPTKVPAPPTTRVPRQPPAPGSQALQAEIGSRFARNQALKQMTAATPPMLNKPLK